MTHPKGRFGDLVAAVQHNCEAVDAGHARDSGMCTYLLGMREYFRWESGVDLGAPVEADTVGSWIANRERHWDALLEEGADRLVSLPLQGGLDAYDEPAANEQIESDRLIYGAGIGRFGIPLFFLAQRESQILREGARVVVAGEELARGFVAPPAVSRGSNIILRLDALRRWLWTRAEVARAREPTDAFRLALIAYERSGRLEETIESMARGELESLILHELGELRAGQNLGRDWESMIEQLDDRRAELVVRAVRDLLADCLVTLPALLEGRATASLHFWFSNFDGMRRALAPQMLRARDCGAGTIDVDLLQETVARGREQWNAMAHDLLDRWRVGGRDAVAARTIALCPV
ncbi:MAG TPA: hypothetical protein VEE84_07775 [Burkholderiaceae bacterium]|nr:hypothetical protein [Burkholderiaceae bacterium]